MNNKLPLLAILFLTVFGCETSESKESIDSVESSNKETIETTTLTEDPAEELEESTADDKAEDLSAIGSEAPEKIETDLLSNEGSDEDLLSATQEKDDNRYFLHWEPCSGKLSFEVSKDSKDELLSNPLIQLFRSKNENSNFVEIMRNDGYSPVGTISFPETDGNSGTFEIENTSGSMTRYGDKVIFSATDENQEEIEKSIECGLNGIEKIKTNNTLSQVDNNNWGHIDGDIEMVFQYGWKPLGDGEFVPILAKVDILSIENGDIAVAMLNYGAPEGMCPILSCEGDVHTFKVMDKYRKVLRTYKFDFPYEDDLDLRKGGKVQAILLDAFDRPKVTYYISYEEYRSIISSWTQPSTWSNEVFVK